jgi:hypothetical protein
VRVDFLRGLVFENTEAMLRTRKKEDASAFRKTLAKDVAMVTEIAFSLLHASAISHHKDQRNRKHKATERAQHMQHLTSLLDKHAEPLGELAEGDDMLDANMMRAGIGQESDSEENDSSSENSEGGNDHDTFALEMDEEALMTPLMSENEDDDDDDDEGEDAQDCPMSSVVEHVDTPEKVEEVEASVAMGEKDEVVLTWSDLDDDDSEDV